MRCARSSRHTARVVMWSGITVSVLLFVVLVARGWGSRALPAAAGLLFLLCIVTCISAGVIGGRSERAVRSAVADLAAARRNARGRETSTEGGPKP